MSTISNRFFVTALDDGTTLHGGLASTKPLVQAWNGNAPEPNWTDESKRPIIYLTLYKGADQASWNNSDIYWNYNNISLSFGANGLSINPSGLFQMTTYNDMPALKIMKNIATSDAVTTSTITAFGYYNLDNAQMPFSASIQLRTTTITGSKGFLGLIYCVDGKSVLTSKTDSVTLYGKLYSGSNGELLAGDYSVNWYINDTLIESTNQSSTHIGNEVEGFPTLTVKADTITDNAIVKAEFVHQSSVVYTDYLSVDDLADPEYMYIQYNGENGNGASLRRGEAVEFSIWVGTLDSAAIDTSFSNFYVRILDSAGAQYNGSLSGIPSVVSNTVNPSKNALGYRALSKDSSNKATLTVSYDNVVTCGGNLTGYVLAETANNS